MNDLDKGFLEKCRAALSAEQTKSLSETNNWSHVDRQQVHSDWDSLYKEFAPLIEGSTPDAEYIQTLIDRHFKIICRFYRPSKEAYIGTGLFYSENQAMKEFHNTYHPNMVAFLGDAISIYAHKNL